MSTNSNAVECNGGGGSTNLGAMVMDARLGSVDAGASRLPLCSISQSSVFWRSPHVFRIRSDISLISDDELPESKAELFLDLDKKLHDNIEFSFFFQMVPIVCAFFFVRESILSAKFTWQ